MSGIYIPGIEMQNLAKGRKYVAELTVTFDGRIKLGIVTSALLEKPKTIEHYPCIPVPDQGRLIDADALEDVIKATMDGMEPGEMKGGLSIVFPILGEMPTVIPADKEGKT